MYRQEISESKSRSKVPGQYLRLQDLLGLESTEKCSSHNMPWVEIYFNSILLWQPSFSFVKILCFLQPKLSVISVTQYLYHLSCIYNTEIMIAMKKQVAVSLPFHSTLRRCSRNQLLNCLPVFRSDMRKTPHWVLLQYPIVFFRSFGERSEMKPNEFNSFSCLLSVFVLKRNVNRQTQRYQMKK